MAITGVSSYNNVYESTYISSRKEAYFSISIRKDELNEKLRKEAQENAEEQDNHVNTLVVKKPLLCTSSNSLG